MKLEAFDLDKLARDLAADGRYKRHIRLIEEFSSSASIFQDLRAAWRSLVKLSEIQYNDGDREDFSQALMMHAAITYSRALHSRTDNRRRCDIVDKGYSKEQRALHEGIVDLRSTALAHYNRPVGIFAAEWIDDRAVVITHDGEFLPPHDVFNRFNYKQAAVHALRDLLQFAVPYVERQRDNRASAVREMLFSEVENGHFRQMPEESRFDPSAFFPNEEAAALFWQSASFIDEKHTIHNPE